MGNKTEPSPTWHLAPSLCPAPVLPSRVPKAAVHARSCFLVRLGAAKGPSTLFITCKLPKETGEDLQEVA